MKNIFIKLKLFITEYLGIEPISFKKIITENKNISNSYPPLTSLDINATYSFNWLNMFNWLKNKNTIYGRDYSSSSERSYPINLKEYLSPVILESNFKDINIEIQDIELVSASKSNLRKFNSLNQMVEKNSIEMIDEISMYKLQKNMSHTESSIFFKGRKNENISCFLLDGRICWDNSGGSHHFAAARYIANKLNIQIPLYVANLCITILNIKSFDKLKKEYYIYILAIQDNEYYLTLEEINKSFKKFKFKFCLKAIFDKSFDDYQYNLLIFPKNDKRSIKINNLLYDNKFTDFFDILDEINIIQSKNWNKLLCSGVLSENNISNAIGQNLSTL